MPPRARPDRHWQLARTYARQRSTGGRRSDRGGAVGEILGQGFRPNTRSTRRNLPGTRQPDAAGNDLRSVEIFSPLRSNATKELRRSRGFFRNLGALSSVV